VSVCLHCLSSTGLTGSAMWAPPPSAAAAPSSPSSSSHALHLLSSHLRRALPQWKSGLCGPPSSSSSSLSRPVVLVVCASALRCQAYVKALRSLSLPPQSLVKSFARHLKLQQQIQQFQQSDVRIVVGTPHRILQLLEVPAFTLHRLQLLLLDGAEDVKRWTVWTLPNVSDDLFLLYERFLHPLLHQRQARLCIY